MSVQNLAVLIWDCKFFLEGTSANGMFLDPLVEIDQMELEQADIIKYGWMYEKLGYVIVFPFKGTNSEVQELQYQKFSLGQARYRHFGNKKSYHFWGNGWRPSGPKYSGP